MNDRKEIHERLKRQFKIIAFDWDGTAVKSRRHPVDDILDRIEDLLAGGTAVVIITGTHFDNIDNQFTSKVDPRLKQNLFVCVNRGSEVFGFDGDGEPVVVHRRVATEAENRKMDAISYELMEVVHEKYDLDTDVIFKRLNRRKWDIIPLPEWSDPPKERIGELLDATQARLHEHGVDGGIQELIDILEEKNREHGIELRITTDVKHLEYGLTDKAASYDIRYSEEEITEETWGAANKIDGEPPPKEAGTKQSMTIPVPEP